MSQWRIPALGLSEAGSCIASREPQTRAPCHKTSFLLHTSGGNSVNFTRLAASIFHNGELITSLRRFLQAEQLPPAMDGGRRFDLVLPHGRHQSPHLCPIQSQRHKNVPKTLAFPFCTRTVPATGPRPLSSCASTHRTTAIAVPDLAFTPAIQDCKRMMAFPRNLVQVCAFKARDFHVQECPTAHCLPPELPILQKFVA